MLPKKTGYSSYTGYPRRKTTKRITMPQLPKRPLRFQIRSIIRHSELRLKSTWWLTVHRRGISRTLIGVDPLEARAVPPGVISGYLTERILYATLVNLFHFVPGVDFNFQSSVDGGRLEMGGLVADFLFPYLRIVINPLGPQHYNFRNIKKDEEQIQTLAELGYQAYMVDESVIYDEFLLEDFLRRIFGGLGSAGGDAGGHRTNVSTLREQEADDYTELYDSIVQLQTEIYQGLGS